jgi:uncharacterized protein
MRSEKLDFGHKDLLYPRLRGVTVPLSEYSFPNLYLFRREHDYEVLFDREIFIRGTSYDGRRYLMPTSDLRTLDIGLVKELMRSVDFLFPVPGEWLTAFSPGEIEISYAEGDADYLFTVGKMSAYQGRRLHKKRNLLKQFVEAYEHEALPLTSDRIGEARFILKDWMEASKMNPDDTDYGPCLEALDRYDALVLCGGICYADHEPAGFVLGEELNEETFVLHFAKARTKFKGVYQYLFNSFAKVLPPKYKYLNLEQDLDRENLRVFKSSYVPDALLKKARVSLTA